MRRALLAVIVALAVPVTLHAEAPAPKKRTLTKEQEKSFRASLKKGRKLEDGKNYLDAVKAFQECLKLDPDDATALSELGWVAYLSHDLKLAEKSTRRSVENASAPNVKGASLYNLGRILEDRGDKAGAILAYKESITVRPHSVVRARLKTLDPRAAAALDPFAPKAMDGPFATIDAYCQPVLVEANKEAAAENEGVEEGEDKTVCACGGTVANVSKGPVKLPYLDMTVFEEGCSRADRWGEVNQDLAVKMKDGWYVITTGILTSYSRRSEVVLLDAKLEAADLIPGGQPEVTYHASTNHSSWGGDTEYDSSLDHLVVVGIGPSGHPSATPALVVTRHETSQEGMGEDSPPPEKVEVDLELDLKWGKGGELTVSGRTKGLDKQAGADLIGKHTLVFP